jgi:tripartite-type tricarboxylate transporter receptor subunit TctC
MEAALSTFLYGVTATPGVPADRVAVLESAVLNALQDPEFLAWATSAGVAADLSPMPAREFQASKVKYQESLAKYQDALRRANQ